MISINGFDLLGNDSAKVLILGSIPSVTSLAEQQYYAHPRNVFWPVIMSLFNDSQPFDYLQAKQVLQAERIAVWDVLKSCERKGSLDASIKKSSIQVNDFITFFKRFNHIEAVVFNGGAAESLYQKNVYPLISMMGLSLQYIKLPSTSPAYAAMCYKDKLLAWAVLKDLVS